MTYRFLLLYIITIDRTSKSITVYAIQQSFNICRAAIGGLEVRSLGQQIVRIINDKCKPRARCWVAATRASD